MDPTSRWSFCKTTKNIFYNEIIQVRGRKNNSNELCWLPGDNAGQGEAGDARAGDSCNGEMGDNGCIPKNEKDVENVRFDDLTEREITSGPVALDWWLQGANFLWDIFFSM